MKRKEDGEVFHNNMDSGVEFQRLSWNNKMSNAVPQVKLSVTVILLAPPFGWEHQHRILIFPLSDLETYPV